MELSAFVSNVKVGQMAVARRLRLVRLVSFGDGADAELLSEALAAGHTTISEVKDPVVGRVRVLHRGTLPLLLLDGELLLGGRQNRMVIASFLIEPGSSVEIEVSCVERGRWSGQRLGFESSETTIHGGLRASKHREVCASLDTHQGYDTDQGDAWMSVDTYIESTGARSPTAAFDDAYQTQSPRVEKETSILRADCEPSGACGRRRSALALARALRLTGNLPTCVEENRPWALGRRERG